MSVVVTLKDYQEIQINFKNSKDFVITEYEEYKELYTFEDITAEE